MYKNSKINLSFGLERRIGLDKTTQIVNEIIKDLSDRCGLGDEWESIDEDIQEEIITEWIKIVDKVLS